MNCLSIIVIPLASKDKGHKMVEIEYVQWLPWMLCNKHRIANEAMVNDGTRFVHFSVTSFLTRHNSCTNMLGWNSIHYYFFFVLKFVVWVVWIPMVLLLGMPWFIALTTNHIYSPSFTILFLLGWWFQQLLVFNGVSHTFFTSDYNLFMFEQGVPLHPCCSYLEIWL